MADYYTEFSFTIDNLNDTEIGWFEYLLEDYRHHEDGEGSELYAIVVTDEDFDWLGFELEVFPERREAWVHSDETGDIDQAANLVADFLDRFRPDEAHGFEWSNTCSKPRTDAFGGGAVFITPHEQRWVSSGQWLAEQFHLFSKGE